MWRMETYMKTKEYMYKQYMLIKNKNKKELLFPHPFVILVRKYKKMGEKFHFIL